jgi:hypothetical protein
MEHTNESRYHTGDTLGDALRFLSDASYAILPRDVAYKIAEFEKNILGGVRWITDKKMGWIDDALTGSDRLREEWQKRYNCPPQTETPHAAAPPPPGTENI